MTGQSFTVQAFADQATRRSALDDVAGRVTTQASNDDPDTMLVLALRPHDNDRRVVASAGNSAIRAAVSVAVAASNLRAWNRATGEAVVDVPMNALPEIMRAAIQPCGIESVRVAAIGDASNAVDLDDGDGATPDEPSQPRHACLAIWLSRSAFTTADAEQLQAETMRQLRQAVADDAVAALEARPEPAVVPRPSEAELAMPELDVLETMPTRAEFDDALGGLQSDQTALIVFGIDAVDSIAGTFGESTVEFVTRQFAERLAAGVRKHDVLARLDDSTFAVLLVDVDRKTAFEVSKRLRARASEPVPCDDGVVDLSVSVGLSHEDGLVDPVELFVAAEAAMLDARQAGGSRMLVAS